MPVTIHIPSMLRAGCGGRASLEVEAPTIREALLGARDRYPELYRSVCDEAGAIRRHVNVFLNDDNIRDIRGPRGDALDTPLAPGDSITIMPAVSGG
jgi:molybdopterin converting factor small subunit